MRPGRVQSDVIGFRGFDFSRAVGLASALRRPGWIALGGLGALLLAGCPSPQSAAVPIEMAAGAPGIDWDHDFEAAVKRAREQNKPLMIDFYTDWCSACKMLEREVYTDSDVIERAGEWVTIKVNGEKRPDVAGAYDVRGYPTIVWAQNSGQPLLILPGYAPLSVFAEAQTEAISRYQNPPPVPRGGRPATG